MMPADSYRQGEKGLLPFKDKGGGLRFLARGATI